MDLQLLESYTKAAHPQATQNREEQGPRASPSNPRVVNTGGGHWAVDTALALKNENTSLRAEVRALRWQLADAKKSCSRWQKRWAVLAASLADNDSDTDMDEQSDPTQATETVTDKNDLQFDPFDMHAAAAAATAMAANSKSVNESSSCEESLSLSGSEEDEEPDKLAQVIPIDPN
eukprot:SAG31_NODE_1283_length_9011_cov_2.475202_10_plen_176_part_00